MYLVKKTKIGDIIILAKQIIRGKNRAVNISRQYKWKVYLLIIIIGLKDMIKILIMYINTELKIKKETIK
jgi:hypothetical protein